MKKFLALVLALVMTMSLVTISSSAAQFTDSEDIKYDEAVSVLSALGVISGKPDGSYAPAETVDRATMAKFIVYIKTGSDGASAYASVPTDLTDIDSSWAKNAIKYCYANGIIAGDGQGHFFPTNPVTTVEAAKMLLVALGYKAEVQGYVGADWKLKVTADATSSKIFEGIDVATDKPLNREETAKLVYNTVVLAETIEESRDENLTTGGVTVSYDKSGENLLGETFSAQRYKATMGDYTYQSFDKTFTYTALNGNFMNINGDENSWIGDFTTAENYGAYDNEEVVVLHKNIDGRETVLGVYPTGKTAAEVSLVRDLKVSNGKLVVNGKSYSVNDDSAAKALYDRVDAKDHLISIDTVKLVDNLDADGNYAHDGKLDNVAYFGYNAGEVTFADDEEIEVNSVSIEYKGNDIADGIEVGDYVVYYQEYATDKYVVSEIAPFEAEATGVKNGSDDAVATDDTFRFDGVWYNTREDDFTAGSKYRVWAYNNVIVGSETIDGKDVKNLVLVYDAEAATLSNGGKDKAAYYNVSGEKKIVDIDGKGTDVVPYGTIDSNAGQNPRDAELYMINVTSDGTEFKEPTDVGTKYTWNASGTVTATDNEIDKVDGVKIASDAVVFVIDSDGDVAVVTGAQLMKNDLTTDDAMDDDNTVGVVATALGYYVDNSALGSNLQRVSHIAVQFDGDIEDHFIGNTGKEVYAYVTDDSITTTIGGEDYTEFKIWNGEENLTVSEKGTATYKKGNVITYDKIEVKGDDNIISGIEDIDTVPGYVTTDPSSTSVMINGDNSYKLNGDTKYLYVDSAADSADAIGKTEGTLKKATTYAKGNAFKDNVIFAVNNDDECTIIVIDVKNALKVDAGTNDNKYTVGSVYGFDADVSSVRLGEKIEFTATEAGTYDFTGVVDGKGNALTGVEVAVDDKIIAYVVARNDDAVTVALS